MNGIYLLLGSNMGDRRENLKFALEQLNDQGIKSVNYSSIYETEPWGESDQPWFLNIVIQVETQYSPEQLLAICLKTEISLGRVRTTKWSARIIDIDILYYKDKIVKSDELSIPHPGIPDRRFTLLPLTEIAAGAIHPENRKSQLQLLEECVDPLEAKTTSWTLT